MFSKEVVETDHFFELTDGAKLLYFYLSMAADDDGFIGKPKTVVRMSGRRPEELSELLEEGYLLSFPSGVCVITHWKMNNYIRTDRYTDTVYKTERQMLEQSENGTYFFTNEVGNPMVYQRDTEIREDKINIDQFSKEKERENMLCAPKEDAKPEKEQTDFTQKEQKTYTEKEQMDLTKNDRQKEPQKRPLGPYENVFLTEEEYEKLKGQFSDYEEKIANLSRKIAMYGYRYQNHYAVLLAWAEQDEKQKQTQPKKPERQGGFVGKGYVPPKSEYLKAYEKKMLEKVISGEW